MIRLAMTCQNVCIMCTKKQSIPVIHYMDFNGPTHSCVQMFVNNVLTVMCNQQQTSHYIIMGRHFCT